MATNASTTSNKRLFHTATDEEIKAGRVTDVYFVRTMQILDAYDASKPVVAEMRAKSLPRDWEWAVLGGVEEVARLLEGLPITVSTLPEGTLFRAYEPVLTIEGNYRDFGIFETAFLGLLCQASGVATMAARCRIAAGDRVVLSFGARRLHPAVAPMIERAAFIGGCDAVSTLLAAELIDEPATGTMPHALILLMGDTVEAGKAFDAVVDPKVNRIVLIDTFNDEKFEALRVAEAMGDRLFGVRLDTPSTRRGNFYKILEEVRWELDLRGYDHVKLVVSGGVDEYLIQELNPVCDAYGVGTAIADAPIIDFSFDIVEIDGKPIAKRGKMSGVKVVERCPNCFRSQVVPRVRSAAGDRCECGTGFQVLNRTLIENGAVVAELPTPQQIRSYVLEQLAHFEDFGWPVPEGSETGSRP